MAKAKKKQAIPVWLQQASTAVKLTQFDCQPLDGSVKICPQCGAFAVVALTPAFVKMQPDNTTHVCLPFFGGCNQGYGR